MGFVGCVGYRYYLRSSAISSTYVTRPGRRQCVKHDTLRADYAPANAPADDAAAALAAAAGVADLAAAAEIDAAEGDELLTAFVRHEIALGHQLTMQFAAAGNAALDVALSNAAEDTAAKRADRMAARLGGASARVMGNVRLALELR